MINLFRLIILTRVICKSRQIIFKISQNILRQVRNQEFQKPILPTSIRPPKNDFYWRCDLCARVRQKGSSRLRHRPIGILQPLQKLFESSIQIGKANVAGTFQCETVEFVFWDMISPFHPTTLDWIHPTTLDWTLCAGKCVTAQSFFWCHRPPLRPSQRANALL